MLNFYIHVMTNLDDFGVYKLMFLVFIFTGRHFSEKILRTFTRIRPLWKLFGLYFWNAFEDMLFQRIAYI